MFQEKQRRSLSDKVMLNSDITSRLAGFKNYLFKHSVQSYITTVVVMVARRSKS